MEAITAEDFGKDGNLAESLARVVGIGIDRSNVEGNQGLWNKIQLGHFEWDCLLSWSVGWWSII